MCCLGNDISNFSQSPHLQPYRPKESVFLHVERKTFKVVIDNKINTINILSKQKNLLTNISSIKIYCYSQFT